MIKVYPSILAADLLNMGNDIERMMSAGVDGLHVDIMDAHFVPNLSFAPAMVSAIHKRFPDVWQDVHLMMDNPQDYLDTFMDAGANAVTVHAEIEADVGEILRKIRARGVKAGISIKPKTPAAAIEPLLDICDLILVMTVEPGFGGQKFMADMMPKISYLRKIGYAGNILVDGGVNAETAVQCVEAGADTLIMGTALLKAQNPSAVMAACRALEK